MSRTIVDYLRHLEDAFGLTGYTGFRKDETAEYRNKRLLVWEFAQNLRELGGIDSSLMAGLILYNKLLSEKEIHEDCPNAEWSRLAKILTGDAHNTGYFMPFGDHVSKSKTGYLDIHPYGPISSEALECAIARTRTKGIGFDIDADSTWFPTRTLRITYRNLKSSNIKKI